MKNLKKWFKSPTHIMMPLVAAAVLVMGTVAYFTDVEAAINTVIFGEVNIDTTETVSGLTKKNIGVTSNGSSPCFVRIRVDVPTIQYPSAEDDQPTQATIEFADASGKTVSAGEFAGMSGDGDSIAVTGTDENDYVWIKNAEDGFWYLNRPLPSGVSVPFISSITYENLYREVEGNSVLPDGITESMLTITITSEAVQSENIVDGSGVQAAKDAFDQLSTESSQ